MITKTQLKVLEIAMLSYGGERIEKDLERGVRGDTLADFVHLELRDVTQGLVSLEAFGDGARAMRSAIAQLEAVAIALESAMEDEKIRIGKGIVFCLGLNPIQAGHYEGRYQTQAGSKTPAGVYQVVKNLMKEVS